MRSPSRDLNSGSEPGGDLKPSPSGSNLQTAQEELRIETVRSFLCLLVNISRTVSDTKRAFYALHTRPINSIYRRVVEELLVELHLLRVNEDFAYDPVFALGVFTIFERFMQGYRPDSDKASIFKALASAEGMDPAQLQQDAERLQQHLNGKTPDTLVEWIQQGVVAGGDEWQNRLQAIARNPKFKYSRPFAIGIFTILEQLDPELIKDEARLNQTLEQVSTALNLPLDKQQKDLELYRSNLDKITQARKTLEDIVESERRRRLQGANPEPATPEPSSAPESTS